MTDFVRFAVQGVPIGCVFGLLAVGLVLTYKTTGVFNLAFAAQAYTSAAVFFVLRRTHEWPLVPAALIAVVVVGPLIGLVLDRALYRHLRTAPALAKLVTSLGLLVAIPQIVNLLFGFGDKPQYRPPPLWPVERVNDLILPERGATIVVNAAEISTILATIVVMVGLALLFRYSAIGLQMRAVVESPRLVQLQAVNADRVSSVSWMLSSLVASLAGVLMAPLFAQMLANDFFTLLVAALAATVFAGLVSIPKAMLGGLALGVLQAEVVGFVPTDNALANGLRPALPFLVLFGLLVGGLVVSLVRGRGVAFAREVSDPMSGVEPPQGAAAEAERPRWMQQLSTWTSWGLAAIGLALTAFVFGVEWRSIVISGVCLGIIMVSMVLMTGIGGTISLCQASFAAIGAFTTAQAVNRWDLPVLGAMLVGAGVAALVGAVLAIPVIRLPAVYAALATLAFALMFETIIRPLDWVSGGNVPVDVPRPLLAGINFNDDVNFLFLAVVIAGLASLAVWAIRRGTTGRFLDAVRGSETGASSIGINPARQRLVAFIGAAGLAGLGGGLLASYVGQANYEANFAFFLGLVWVAVLVTMGVRSLAAAFVAAISFYAMPKILNTVFSWPGAYLADHPDVSGFARTILESVEPAWAVPLAFALFGLGALTYARHPEGILQHQTSSSINAILRRTGRRAPAEEAADEEAIDLRPALVVDTAAFAAVGVPVTVGADNGRRTRRSPTPT
jgi:branched-subunit amino acid ABC-type transport system permease component